MEFIVNTIIKNFPQFISDCAGQLGLVCSPTFTGGGGLATRRRSLSAIVHGTPILILSLSCMRVRTSRKRRSPLSVAIVSPLKASAPAEDGGVAGEKLRTSAVPRGGRVTRGDGGRLLRAEMRQGWRQIRWAQGWQRRPVARQSPPLQKANVQ